MPGASVPGQEVPDFAGLLQFEDRERHHVQREQAHRLRLQGLPHLRRLLRILEKILYL